LSIRIAFFLIHFFFFF